MDCALSSGSQHRLCGRLRGPDHALRQADRTGQGNRGHPGSAMVAERPTWSTASNGRRPSLSHRMIPTRFTMAASACLRPPTGAVHWDGDQSGSDAQRQEQATSIRRTDRRLMTPAPNITTRFLRSRSHRGKDLIWVGTDDGLIHITRDGGKNWNNVTPNDCRSGAGSA